MQLLYNATIYTQDHGNPVASAVAIQNGHILDIGSDEQILAEVSSNTHRKDLTGLTIIPGLCDSHIHLEYLALGLQKINCETATKAECLHRVAERAKITPPGEWILGHGWNHNEWSDTATGERNRSTIAGGLPSAMELDAVAPNHPVFLTAKSLHSAWVNSLAMQIVGINSHTPEPEGGKIVCTPGNTLSGGIQGNPTGILLERATELVSQRLPEPSIEEISQAILKTQSMLWQMGITSVHDFDGQRCFSALQMLHARGELQLRVIKGITFENLQHAVSFGLFTGSGDNFLRIGSVKLFADGALGPKTAAMFQPYDGETPVDANTGILFLNEEELIKIGKETSQNGLSLAIHAIGDRANHVVLNAYTALRQFEHARGLPALRHRIEHVQLIQPDDVNRLAELDVVASMQPIHATSDMVTADRYWGKRVANAYTWRTLLNHNTILAFGSDAPVESPNPFWGLHAAVTRRRADGSPGPQGWQPAQRLNVTEALGAYTVGAAYAAGMENLLGKLAPGYLADLVILDTDPFTCDPDHLRNICPLATMVNGNWVWQADAIV
jgi:predicted amidohydrolase YtcJ